MKKSDTPPNVGYFTDNFERDIMNKDFPSFFLFQFYFLI